MPQSINQSISVVLHICIVLQVYNTIQCNAMQCNAMRCTAILIAPLFIDDIDNDNDNENFI